MVATANKNPTRATTKKSCVSEADSNLNNCNRPNTITNNQNHLITHKRPTAVVNRRPENQDIYKRKKVVSGRQTYGESIRKTMNKIVIFGDSITNFRRYHKNILNQKTMKIVEQDSIVFHVHYHGTYCTV